MKATGRKLRYPSSSSSNGRTHVGFGHAAVVQQAHELLHDEARLLGGLQRGPVAHHQRAHQLQHRNLCPQRRQGGRRVGEEGGLLVNTKK